MNLEHVAVFCGSARGVDPRFREAAETLGRKLAHRGTHLIYGGGGGLMEDLANAALDAGGQVTGIIPRAQKASSTRTKLSEVVFVETIPERKAAMAERANAFVALPGGSGTLEEIAEQWTWAQIGIHSKPCGVLNIAGFYNPLVAQIDNMRQYGFTKPRNLDLLVVDNEVDRLLTRIESLDRPFGE